MFLQPHEGPSAVEPGTVAGDEQVLVWAFKSTGQGRGSLDAVGLSCCSVRRVVAIHGEGLLHELLYVS